MPTSALRVVSSESALGPLGAFEAVVGRARSLGAGAVRGLGPVGVEGGGRAAPAVGAETGGRLDEPRRHVFHVDEDGDALRFHGLAPGGCGERAFQRYAGTMSGARKLEP